jgi:hypothetical protein
MAMLLDTGTPVPALIAMVRRDASGRKHDAPP